MENKYCVILAGGAGARLWPESRQLRPKQFIDFLGTGKSLLQTTYERYSHFIPQQNILVVTNHLYDQIVREQLPQLPTANLLLEPMRRNTMPSVVWATLIIMQRNVNASIVVTPVDHLINNETAYEEDIRAGLDYVSTHNRVLSVGVIPSRPETSYGYIQMGKHMKGEIYTVKSFTEKPDTSFAHLFVENGEFLWNTGLFLWKAHSFITRLRRGETTDQLLAQAVAVSEQHGDLSPLVSQLFSMSPSISLEKGILERVTQVDVLRAHFRWADLGTWSALYDALPKDTEQNAIMTRDAQLYDCEGCLVRVPHGKVVVLEGLKDYMVVDEGNMLVICPRNDQKSIRRFMNDVQVNKGEDYI